MSTAGGFVPAPPKGAVARVSGLKYALLCELCGKEAGFAEVAVRGVPAAYPVEEECLVVNDWGEQVFLIRQAVPVLDLLERGDVKGLHLLMRELVEGPDRYGLRCYCPDCGRILCEDHYRVDAVYDEGFYDCSNATCPKGHTREIDD